MNDELRSRIEAELSHLPTRFDEKTLAKVLGLSISKIRKDRQRKQGVPYQKDGSAVRYLRCDAIDYMLTKREGTRNAFQ